MKLTKNILGFFLLSSLVATLVYSILSQTGANKVAVASPHDFSYKITGQVIDENGLPVEGARVWSFDMTTMINGNPNTAFTDENGRFILENLPASHRLVFASKPAAGYPDSFSLAPAAPSVEAIVGDDNPNPDIIVKLGPKAPHFSGKVVDKVTNKPLKDSGVKICLADSPNQCVSNAVDDNGAFDLLVPPDRAFTAEIGSKGHKTTRVETKNNQGAKDDRIVVHGTERKQLTISMEPNP
jgi:hypothetical protein